MATGTFGIVIFGNTPFNDTLVTFDIQKANNQEITEQKLKFEGSWNRLHSVRTVAAINALYIVIIACLYDEKNN